MDSRGTRTPGIMRRRRPRPCRPAAPAAAPAAAAPARSSPSHAPASPPTESAALQSAPCCSEEPAGAREGGAAGVRVGRGGGRRRRAAALPPAVRGWVRASARAGGCLAPAGNAVLPRLRPLLAASLLPPAAAACRGAGGAEPAQHASRRLPADALGEEMVNTARPAGSTSSPTSTYIDCEWYCGRNGGRWRAMREAVAPWLGSSTETAFQESSSERVPASPYSSPAA
jgi:hypothetical protein